MVYQRQAMNAIQEAELQKSIYGCAFKADTENTPRKDYLAPEIAVTKGAVAKQFEAEATIVECDFHAGENGKMLERFISGQQLIYIPTTLHTDRKKDHVFEKSLYVKHLP